MLLPIGSPIPTSTTNWVGHQTAIQTSPSNAWPGSKIAAVTLGIILGIIVFGTLLCFALYRLHRFIVDMISEEAEAAIGRLELGRGRSNHQRSDPSPRPSPSSLDRPTNQNTSPTDVLPPSDEENQRRPAFENSLPGFRIMSPCMLSPLSRSPGRIQYQPSGYRSPQSSYERVRPRQCSIGDLPTILPRASAHGSDSPRSPSPQIEEGPRDRNVGEARAVVRRVSSRGSDYPRRRPSSFWYLPSPRRAPPPNPRPSPERERERRQPQEQAQPTDNDFPMVVRRDSSREFSSSRRTSSRRRTSYRPPYVTSDSHSDRGSAEGSRR